MESSDKSMHDLLKYHKIGTEYLSKALSIDETSQKKDEAIKFYQLGIEEFLMGLNIKLNGENKERGIHIQEKMENNLTMALDRIHILKHSSPRLESIKKRLEQTKAQRNSLVNNISPSSIIYRKPLGATQTPANQKPTSMSSAKNTLSQVRPSSSVSRPVSTNKNLVDPNNNSNSDKVQLKDLLKIPNVDRKMVEVILDEIVDKKNVKFSDIIGQKKAKQALQETVILPSLNPELFTGLLTPLKGLLLFGPPGNGKTMLAKAAANEANCNFFNINSSSLTSKYVGDGEKLVRTLFAVARHLQPSIIFIDEIDSILSSRKDNEHEASRRLKTEFFAQFDGMQTDKNDRILVMGATNRPYDLDSAALRRFPKRVYVGLPDLNTRVALIKKLIDSHAHSLSESQIIDLARRADGYSGSDLNSLATDAAYGPIREKSIEDLKVMTKNSIRPMKYQDFINSLSQIKITPPKDLDELENWNKMYGANS
ncbi:unnamed protein product [Brachionus calyciflorus]|uniref:microtubule-severing ATPase n=1 Tax=Brachionus calyciflorus TaxID=104777 RepID=A0A813QV85_9BILA|nr:unnamed protein product [Brachionus calyciflorus]